jgi:hypothetical protein
VILVSSIGLQTHLVKYVSFLFSMMGALVDFLEIFDMHEHCLFHSQRAKKLLFVGRACDM